MALKALALNLRPEDYDRVRAHVARLGSDPMVRNLMGEVSIASVGRMALITGLDVLDERYGMTYEAAPAEGTHEPESAGDGTEDAGGAVATDATSAPNALDASNPFVDDGGAA